MNCRQSCAPSKFNCPSGSRVSREHVAFLTAANRRNRVSRTNLAVAYFLHRTRLTHSRPHVLLEPLVQHGRRHRSKFDDQRVLLSAEIFHHRPSSTWYRRADPIDPVIKHRHAFNPMRIGKNNVRVIQCIRSDHNTFRQLTFKFIGLRPATLNIKVSVSRRWQRGWKVLEFFDNYWVFSLDTRRTD